MSQGMNRDQGNQNVTQAEQRLWRSECHKCGTETKEIRMSQKLNRDQGDENGTKAEQRPRR